MFKLLTILPTAFIKSLLVITKILAKHIALTLLVFLLILSFSGYSVYNLNTNIKSQLLASQSDSKTTKEKLDQIQKDYEKLKNEDQVKKNKDLQDEINNIHDTYQKAMITYQTLQDFKAQTKKGWDNFDKDLANTLNQLSNRKYQDASKSIDDLNKNIQKEQDKLIPTPPPAPKADVNAISSANAPTTTAPPGAGYQRINVQSEAGAYVVDIIAADLNSTKVIVDTASDSDCGNDCPVMSLGAYASRSGAYAGINGSFFCPQTYPSCVGKTNSF